MSAGIRRPRSALIGLLLVVPLVAGSCSSGRPWRQPTINPATEQVTQAEAEAVALPIIEEFIANAADLYEPDDWQTPRTLGPSISGTVCSYSIFAQTSFTPATMEELRPAFSEAMEANDLPASRKVEYLNGQEVLSSVGRHTRVLLDDGGIGVEVAAHPDQCE